MYLFSIIETIMFPKETMVSTILSCVAVNYFDLNWKEKNIFPASDMPLYMEEFFTGGETSSILGYDKGTTTGHKKWPLGTRKILHHNYNEKI